VFRISVSSRRSSSAGRGATSTIGRGRHDSAESSRPAVRAARLPWAPAEQRRFQAEGAGDAPELEELRERLAAARAVAVLGGESQPQP